ncbi:histidine kinase [Actinokineospora auranticolor]|uniref:histidine kinase n=1 Tax=Actinokineospora auranticolor TaxID=155976 RepID=UPI0011B0CC36|nr:histidine kinase [Actinokineospora auranticolor]
MSGGSAGARRVSAAYLALSLALLGVAGWCLLARALAPGDGAVVNLGARVGGEEARGIVVVAVDQPGPLRVGDQVVAIGGVPMADRLASGPPGGAAVAAGDHLAYRVLRDGALVDVDVTARAYPLFDKLAEGWPTLLVVALLVVAAAAVFQFRPGEPAARAGVVTAGLSAVTAIGPSLFPLQVLDLVAGGMFWRWLAGEVAFALLWASVLHFALAFPARWPVRRYRTWVALAYLGAPVLYGVTSVGALVVFDSPLAVLEVVGAPAVPPALLYPVAVLAVAVARYSTEPESRRQVLPPAVALGVASVAHLALWAVPTNITGAPLLPERYHPFAFIAVPFALLLVVLRHRLIDVEVALSRSLVYGGLSAAVMITYIAVVAGLALLFPPIDQVWQQAIAAAGVAAVVHPLRGWLQGRVNERFFGHADDPYHLVSTLAGRLADARTPGSMLPDVVETVAAALRLRYVAIEVETGGLPEIAASTGRPGGHTTALPLVFRGERIGRLVVVSRSAPRRRDRVALAEVARHAGAAVYTTRLTLDLRRSRDRLVRAREEERRRLLHELHDGVGPTLAAIALGLDASLRGVDQGSPTGVLLGRLRDELQGAITEIRRLAHGLRPPVLDQLGLVPAVREYAGALASRTARGAEPGVTITLEAPSALPGLPASVDVAAYRIICEALTNVTRHAHARWCAVKLWVDDDLHIEVVDDGVGLPCPASGGVGLASMRERAVELGGDCLVADRDRGGTRVLATLPLPKATG